MADASIQGEEKGHSYIKRRVATTQYNAAAFLLPPLLPSYQGWKRRQGHYPCLRCVHIPMYIAYGASCIVEVGPNAALDHANISTFLPQGITCFCNILFSLCVALEFLLDPSPPSYPHTYIRPILLFSPLFLLPSFPLPVFLLPLGLPTLFQSPPSGLGVAPGSINVLLEF